jgi:hypothetical protein
MHVVAWKPALVSLVLLSLHRALWQTAQGIETFELKAAIIAEQTVQTGELENDWRTMVTALDSGTLASGTPHRNLPSAGRFLHQENEDEAGLREDTKRPRNPPDICFNEQNGRFSE